VVLTAHLGRKMPIMGNPPKWRNSSQDVQSVGIDTKEKREMIWNYGSIDVSLIKN